MLEKSEDLEINHSFLLLTTVSLNVAGQFLMKLGTNSVGSISGDIPTVVTNVMRALSNRYIIAGMAAYGLSSILWLVLLSRVDLSYAYPALSLGYVLVTVVSALALGEAVSELRWAGVVVICIGVIMLSRG